MLLALSGFPLVTMTLLVNVGGVFVLCLNNTRHSVLDAESIFTIVHKFPPHKKNGVNDPVGNDR